MFCDREERRTDLGQAVSHLNGGDADLVLGISRTGLFCVKISSINKYLIPILSPCLLALKNAKWSVYESKSCYCIHIPTANGDPCVHGAFGS